MAFTPNRHFRRDYKRIFKRNPEAANLLLLLCELADENGQVSLAGPDDEGQLALLMNARFEDPGAWQLGGRHE